LPESEDMSCYPPKRLLIVEEALRSTGFGHWYEYIRTIVDGVRREGGEVQVMVHRQAEPGIVESLGAAPLLRYSAWDKIYDAPSALKRYAGGLKHNLRLAKDVRRFLAGAERYDVVLVPTVLAHHVLAWYWNLRTLGGRKFDRLATIFVNTPGQRLANGDFCFPPNTWFMRAVLRRMKGYQDKRSFATVAETRLAASGLDPHPWAWRRPARSGA